MVEIISYLGNNGFAVYIDSACGFLTTRELGDKEKAAKLKEFALKRGWNPISMKNEFKTIYGERVERSN